MLANVFKLQTIAKSTLVIRTFGQGDCATEIRRCFVKFQMEILKETSFHHRQLCFYAPGSIHYTITASRSSHLRYGSLTKSNQGLLSIERDFLEGRLRQAVCRELGSLAL